MTTPGRLLGTNYLTRAPGHSPLQNACPTCGVLRGERCIDRRTGGLQASGDRRWSTALRPHPARRVPAVPSPDGGIDVVDREETDETVQVPPGWVPPEPATVRDVPDSEVVQVFGRLTYVTRRTTRQGRDFLTGVVRDDVGEVAFWVPPNNLDRVSREPQDGDQAVLMARVDRRPGPSLLTVSQLGIVVKRWEAGPRRGDAVAEWIKRARDEHGHESGDLPAWRILDELLNDYRLRADTGTPLDQDVQGPHGDGS